MVCSPLEGGQKDTQHGGARRAVEIGEDREGTEVCRSNENVAPGKYLAPLKQLSVGSSPMPQASEIMLLLHSLSPPTLGRQ